VFETAQDTVLDGSNAPYPWPYVEGVTVDEAANHLAFISRGLDGRLLPPQNGPIRLTLPWKCGFKSAKVPIKISFVEKRPSTFWEAIGPSEYGFWANVDPPSRIRAKRRSGFWGMTKECPHAILMVS
jgi:sulfoxide reductase catalytic subunit YedY